MYYVSNHGRVLSEQKGYRHILSPSLDNYGYLGVNLYNQGKEIHRKIHRLVAKAFIPNPWHLPVVNHIDEDRTDNRACNLQWCTQKHNYHYGNCELKNHLSLALSDAKTANLGLLCKHDRILMNKVLAMVSKMKCLKYRPLS